MQENEGPENKKAWRRFHSVVLIILALLIAFFSLITWVYK